MRKTISTLATAGVIAFAPVVVSGSAQAATNAPTPSATQTVTKTVHTTTTEHDRTGLWGLLGLAGLAGLAGLRKKKEHHTETHQVRPVHTERHENVTTTSRDEVRPDAGRDHVHTVSGASVRNNETVASTNGERR